MGSENRAARTAQLAKDRLARRAKRVDIFKRAEKYVKEYRDQERDDLRLKREARKSGNYHVPSEPNLAFVMRIRGINQVAPKVKKVLQLFRLRQINNGVFHQVEQGYHQHVENLRTLHYLGHTQLEIHSRDDLQVWIHEGCRQEDTHHFKRCRRRNFGSSWHHLRRGCDPRSPPLDLISNTFQIVCGQ